MRGGGGLANMLYCCESIRFQPHLLSVLSPSDPSLSSASLPSDRPVALRSLVLLQSLEFFREINKLSLL